MLNNLEHFKYLTELIYNIEQTGYGHVDIIYNSIDTVNNNITVSYYKTYINGQYNVNEFKTIVEDVELTKPVLFKIIFELQKFYTDLLKYIISISTCNESVYRQLSEHEEFMEENNYNDDDKYLFNEGE